MNSVEGDDCRLEDREWDGSVWQKVIIGGDNLGAHHSSKGVESRCELFHGVDSGRHRTAGGDGR